MVLARCLARPGRGRGIYSEWEKTVGLPADLDLQDPGSPGLAQVRALVAARGHIRALQARAE